MRINTNVAALNAIENNFNSQNKIQGSLEKLSSGLRVNKASDDSSGLAIADKLRTQASALKQSIDNGNSAVALTQIADKAMSEVSNIIDVIKQKTIQGLTATTSSDGQLAILSDISALISQVDNITSQTNYNTQRLIDGSGSLTFQMGETKNDTISLVVDSVDAVALDLTQTGTTLADTGLSVLDLALTSLNNQRATIGSIQNQLESSIRNMSTAVTNIKNAESVIRDVDYAAESANFNKQNVIVQAGTYALSQANAANQNVMKLLQ